MRFLVIAVVLATIPMSATADSLNYSGETTSYTSYSGTHASDTAWDYVYSIDPWTGPSTTSWGIVSLEEPIAHWESSGWTYTYYSAEEGGIPYSTGKLAELYQKPGIVWIASGASDAAYFHFQTAITGPGFPVPSLYDGDNWTAKTEYSANPEPTSLALLMLALGGAEAWRRRRRIRERT